MGLELWPDTEEHACNVVTAVTVPEGIDDEQLRRRMVDQFGVLISGSLFNTPIYGKLVRIGHMGRTCSPSYALTAAHGPGALPARDGPRRRRGRRRRSLPRRQLDPV